MSDTARALNPVEVEQAILSASNEVAKGVEEYSRVHAAYLEAERLFDLAWARSYMSLKGPVEERKQQSVLNTEQEKFALNVAEVSFKYVDKRLRAAESRLSAFQTLSKSVTSMYGAAGRGEY
jgi:hypothetical protein